MPADTTYNLPRPSLANGQQRHGGTLDLWSGRRGPGAAQAARRELRRTDRSDHARSADEADDGSLDWLVAVLLDRLLHTARSLEDEGKDSAAVRGLASSLYRAQTGEDELAAGRADRLARQLLGP